MKSRPGFTIAELVVAAGIIAMISALVLTNFRGSSQKAALDNEAERLSSILRQANINSLIGLTVNGARPKGGYGVHVAACQADCAYQIFPDNDGSHLYSETIDLPIQRFGMLDDNVYVVGVALPASVCGSGDVNNDGTADSTDALIVSTYVGNNDCCEGLDFNFDNADVNCDGQITEADFQIILNGDVGAPIPSEPTSFLDVAFIPPQGTIFINGSQAYTQAEITLGFKNTSYTKKIILDRRTGQINIQ